MQYLFTALIYHNACMVTNTFHTSAGCGDHALQYGPNHRWLKTHCSMGKQAIVLQLPLACANSPYPPKSPYGHKLFPIFLVHWGAIIYPIQGTNLESPVGHLLYLRGEDTNHHETNCSAQSFHPSTITPIRSQSFSPPLGAVGHI